jgi:phosphoglycerate dehydrogenase-like enzyme
MKGSRVLLSPRLMVSVQSEVAGLRECCVKHMRTVPQLSTLLDNGEIELSTSLPVSPDCNILVCDPKRGVDLVNGSSLSNLKWMQSTYAGVNVLVNNTTRRDYVLTRVGHGFGPQMAEYCLGWILFHTLEINRIQSLQASKTWDQSSFLAHKKSVAGQTIGILGAGNIGCAVAGAAESLGMHTIGFARSALPRLDSNMTTVTTNLDEVLSQSNVIVNTLPSTQHTRNLLTLDRLSVCKALSPMFINVGRGDVIRSDVLVAALDENYLSQAVLDVMEVEPLPIESTLWKHPRINITPHISALSTPDIVARVFVDNLVRFVESDQLICQVDWNLGY